MINKLISTKSKDEVFSAYKERSNAAFGSSCFEQNLIPIILKYAIASSEKPTNTAYALMCTSKQWGSISKAFFDRDKEVIDSFVGRIEKLADIGFNSVYVNDNKNIFFFLWMVNFLHNKKIEIKLNVQSSEKSEIVFKFNDDCIKLSEQIKAYKSNLFEFVHPGKKLCRGNTCKIIIEQVFNDSMILQEITFAEILCFFKKSFFAVNRKLDDIRLHSLLYEILYHVAKNTAGSSLFILIERIAQELRNHVKMINADDNCSEIEDYILNDRFYKLLGIIEWLSNHRITKESSVELKFDFLTLICQFFNVFYWGESRLLKSNVFLSLAVRYLQLCGNYKNLPDQTFDLIFDLQEFPEESKLLAMIEAFMKSSFCSLDNFLKIVREDVKVYFLMQRKDYFFSDTKCYLNVIEDMVLKMQNKSYTERIKVLESVEQLFQFIEKALKDDNAMVESDRADCRVVLKGFLSYLKSINRDNVAELSHFAPRHSLNHPIFF